MASANLSETTIALINNECKKASAVQISRKISRCRANMTTIRNKMDSNTRTLEAHPANDAAASELRLHLKDIPSHAGQLPTKRIGKRTRTHKAHAQNNALDATGRATQ